MTGSDEERALAKALASAFRNAKHLFCMLQCKSNVRQHLTDVGVSTENRKHILAKLFGCDGATQCRDEVTMENKLSTVMQYIWFNSIHVGGYLLQNIFPKI